MFDLSVNTNALEIRVINAITNIQSWLVGLTHEEIQNYFTRQFQSNERNRVEAMIVANAEAFGLTKAAIYKVLDDTIDTLV